MSMPLCLAPLYRRRSTYIALLVPSIGLACPSVQAQVRDSRALEEVIVTAQKNYERLQDVPVPVTVLGIDALLDSNQLRLQDYYTKVPGLSLAVDPGRGGAAISLRGITTGFANPTVGTVIDDVPYGASTAVAGGSVVYDVDPSDLERIEVLRGPQGTLYGASSLGGLIKYVTVEPSTDDLTGQLRAGLTSVKNGDEMGYYLRGSVNLPLSDTLAVRASAYTRLDPGYIDDPVLDIQGVNRSDSHGGRLSALWRPSEVISVKFSALRQDNQRDGSSEVFVQQGFGDLQQSNARGSGEYDKRIEAYDATLRAKLGTIDLTSVTGYNVTEGAGSLDYTWLFGQLTQSLFGVTGTPWVDDIYKTKKFSQEIRLAGSAGPRADWLLGAIYMDEDTAFDGGWVATDFSTGAQVGDLLDQHWPTSYEEYAAFANITLHVFDRFDLQIGARQSENRQTYLLSSSGLFVSDVPEKQTKDNSFTYLVTPQFKISPDFMVYARFASGYRPGGSNGAVSSRPSFAPDTTENYEVGLKGFLWNQTISFDTSIYYIDWNDIQVGLLESSMFLIGNEARAKSQGVELSIESQSTTGLTIAGSATWGDAEVTEISANNTLSVINRGDRLPYSSRLSGHLSIDQEFILGSRSVGYIGASVSYVGERLSSFPSGSTQRGHFPAYTKTDVRAGVQFDSWAIDLFVNNIADKRAIVIGGPTDGNPVAFICIQPRTSGLSLTKKF